MMTTYHSNLFQDVKLRLAMSDIVYRYVGQISRKKTISCPFHKEKTPSLKVYENSFYCFGCGAGGDIINFVSKLFNLSNHEAAEKIDADFGLGLTNAEYDAVAEMKFEYERKKKKDEENRFKHKINQLCEIRYNLWCNRFDGTGQAQAAVDFLDYVIDNYTIADLKEVEAVARRFS